MALLSAAEIHLHLDFQQIELAEAEQYLKSLVSKYANLIFNQQAEVHVLLQEGSLKVTLAVVGALYIGIGQYGSFRSGIDYMIKDAKLLKSLIINEIIKNGVNETDILVNKRLRCDPDRIRRVLLAINRVESMQNLSKFDLNKELSKIRTSVGHICETLSNEDAGFFAMSLNKKYWPQDGRAPYWIKHYTLVAREEDILQYPIASFEASRVRKLLS